MCTGLPSIWLSFVASLHGRSTIPLVVIVAILQSMYAGHLFGSHGCPFVGTEAPCLVGDHLWPVCKALRCVLLGCLLKLCIQLCGPVREVFWAYGVAWVGLCVFSV